MRNAKWMTGLFALMMILGTSSWAQASETIPVDQLTLVDESEVADCEQNGAIESDDSKCSEAELAASSAWNHHHGHRGHGHRGHGHRGHGHHHHHHHFGSQSAANGTLVQPQIALN